MTTDKPTWGRWQATYEHVTPEIRWLDYICPHFRLTVSVRRLFDETRDAATARGEAEFDAVCEAWLARKKPSRKAGAKRK